MKEKYFTIYVKVIPKSSTSKVEKLSEKEYKVKLNSPPIDGKANKELIELLSEYFSIPKSNIVIQSGMNSKNKVIKIFSKD
jgi:uncharacterized protein (TIGR00251 family)